MEKYKKCKVCGNILPITDFYTFHQKGRIYFIQSCKSCYRKHYTIANTKRYYDTIKLKKLYYYNMFESFSLCEGSVINEDLKVLLDNKAVVYNFNVYLKDKNLRYCKKCMKIHSLSNFYRNGKRTTCYCKNCSVSLNLQYEKTIYGDQNKLLIFRKKKANYQTTYRINNNTYIKHRLYLEGYIINEETISLRKENINLRRKIAQKGGIKNCPRLEQKLRTNQDKLKQYKL